jgi:hypothetical protein
MLRAELRGPAEVRIGKMLVDSGADQNMIPRALFEALGLKTLATIELGGVGGHVLGHVGELEFVTLAGSWRGPVVGAPMVGSFPPVLGYNDFFKRFDVTLCASDGWFSVNAATLTRPETGLRS